MPYGFVECCVCIKQSSEPLCCGLFRLLRASPSHPTKATLIPKLRGHFAEFLRDGSLARLRILSSPTCVGLRYGWLQFSLAGFPDSMASDTRVPSEDFPRPSLLGVNDPPYLTKGSAYGFRPDKPASGCHSLLYYRIGDNELLPALEC